jgi:hypothetical protein
MTPKEKARELVEKYYWTFGDGYLGQQHIQCALIAVDEIIKEMDNVMLPNPFKQYWNKVKQEIQEL